MKRSLLALLAAIALLGAMVVLLWGPLREDSATVDEPLLLTCGYAGWRGFGNLNAGHPPLGQTLVALPLTFMAVQWTPAMEAQADYCQNGWKTNPVVAVDTPINPSHWFFRLEQAARVLTGRFLFEGANDPERLLLAGRWVCVVIALLTGVAVGAWSYRLGGPTAAVVAVAFWVFNPVILAYGHLVLNDIEVALLMLLAVWVFSSYLTNPTLRLAILAGLAIGGALVMKFSALLLGPMLGVLLLVHWWQTSCAAAFAAWRKLPLVGVAAYVVILIAYAPECRPAPALTPAEMASWHLPSWFGAARLVLIPPGFFQGIALQLEHARLGHAAFFCGEWRMHGWWQYFPVALTLKTPIPLLLAILVGLSLALVRWKTMTFARSSPWIAGLVYLLGSMTGTIDIGVRHVLPLVAFWTVAAAVQLNLAGRFERVAAWTLASWLALVAWSAHPYYLAYCNELAGGPEQGWRYLSDSSYDWGQDAKRLQLFLKHNGIDHVYVDFFGTRGALERAGVRCTPVTAEQARQIHNAYLVVSASYLTRPRWDWLRSSHEPVARVSYTLFVYRLP